MKYLSFVFILLCSFTAFGATYTVTRNDDRDAICVVNDCSLREAVKMANASVENDVINFADNLSKIALTDQILIDYNERLEIQGTGADKLTISGEMVTRIFFSRFANVVIRDLVLADGYEALEGVGAMLVYGGSVTLDRVFVLRNQAGFTSYAGGIDFSGGTHFIYNSTIAFNRGGAQTFAGGISNSGNLTIVNSTISNNSAGYGGGIYNSGNLTLRSVTIAQNSASPSCTGGCSGDGAGILQSFGTLELINTIVATNTTVCSGACQQPPEISFRGGTIHSLGGNLIGDSAGDSTFTANPIAYQSNDVLDVNPLLGPLQNNGGPTPTHALLSGSPIINKGNNANAPATDQRALARVVDGIIDIGAYEFAQPTKTRKRVRFF